MNARTITFGLASDVTALLLVAALTIQLPSGPYGESPGVGILGVFAGAVGALLAGIVVVAVAGGVSRGVLAGLVAYGTLGRGVPRHRRAPGKRPRGPTSSSPSPSISGSASSSQSSPRLSPGADDGVTP